MAQFPLGEIVRRSDDQRQCLKRVQMSHKLSLCVYQASDHLAHLAWQGLSPLTIVRMNPCPTLTLAFVTSIAHKLDQARFIPVAAGSGHLPEYCGPT